MAKQQQEAVVAAALALNAQMAAMDVEMTANVDQLLQDVDDFDFD